MAKSTENVVMQGASGKVGKMLVFRQRGDKTIIAKAPKVIAERPVSAKQMLVRERFQNASLYAQSAIADPELKAIYAAKATVNQSAYNVAFKDFLVLPEVRSLDDRNYQGQIGGSIEWFVKDILPAVQVTIEIYDADQLIESGAATQMQQNPTRWQYIATATHPDPTQAIYHITIRDVPGNEVTIVVDNGE